MNAVAIILIHIGGNLAFSFSGAESVRLYLEQKLAAELRRGVTVDLREIADDPCPGRSLDWGEATQRLVCYRDFARAQKLTGKRTAVHFLTGPTMYNGQRFMVGAARQCDMAGASFSTAEFQNSLGVDRLPHTFAAAAHEIAHALGAGHDSRDLNLMHPDPLPLAHNDLKFNKKARREVRRCANKWRGK